MRAVYANYLNDWYYLAGDKSTPTSYTTVITLKDLLSQSERSKMCIKDNNVVLSFALSDIFENDLTNKENYANLLSSTKDNPDMKIKTLFPRYQMVVSYDVIDATTSSYAVAVPVSATSERMDVVPLYIDMGCLANSETVHRVGKQFKSRIKIGTNSTVQMGIMRTRSSAYSIRIRDIAIYQSTNLMTNAQIEAANKHYSSCNNAYSDPYFFRDNDFNYGSQLIYSSKQQGIEFSPIKLTRKPKLLTFDISVISVSHVVAFNKTDLDKFIYIETGDVEDNDTESDIWYKHCCIHINGPHDCVHCREYCNCKDPGKEEAPDIKPAPDDDEPLDRYVRLGGDVETYEDLPTTGQRVGDMYNILYGDYAGANYVWDGVKWDKLSDTVTIPEYVMEDELMPLNPDEIDKVIGNT